MIAPAGLSPRGESPRRPSLKVARIYTECTYSQNIQFVYQIKISICSNRGRMESLSNDDVSSLNAHMESLGNEDVSL